MKKYLFSLILFFASITILHAQTIDQIIDNYVTAIGGTENWSKIQSIKMDGYGITNSLKIPYTMQAIHMEGIRVDAEFRHIKFLDIVTPYNAWSRNPLAKDTSLHILTKTEFNTKVDELDLQDAFINYKDKGASVELLGKYTEDNKEYFKIRMTSKINNKKTYYFDSKTFLLFKIESIAMRNSRATKIATKFMDYKTLNFGIKLPFKSDDGTTVYVIKNIVINPVIDKAVFNTF